MLLCLMLCIGAAAPGAFAEETTIEETSETAEEQSAPAREPVEVHFDVEPEEADLSVFGSVDGEDVLCSPEEDGSYRLYAGEYRYDAACDGYVSAEDVAFTVGDEAVTISVSLEKTEMSAPETVAEADDAQTADAAVLEEETESAGAETLLTDHETVNRGDIDLPASDSLLEAYFKSLSQGGTPSGPRKAPAVSAGNRLSGATAVLYSFLSEKVSLVAAGQLTSTVFSIEIDSLGMNRTAWSLEELGITGDISDDQGYLTNEAQEALNAALENELGFGAAFNALLYDHPYELYWFDKTVGYSYGYGITYDGENLGVGGELTIEFAVAQEYAAGDCVVDSSVGQRVQTAASNAASIVSSYAGNSDRAKLEAYRNEICARAAYNYDALNEGTAYGNPWQLIWVFDGDSSTNVVCEGYSKAFQYLCDLSVFQGQVRCISVDGMMVGGTGAGAHMWNIVRMPDGVSYLVDVTNCDSGTIGEPDQLFLALPASGDVDSGYVMQASGSDISYTYSDSTRSAFGNADLILGAARQTLDSGDCGAQGDNVTWTLYEDGELVIEGTGDMNSFFDPVPWQDYLDDITTVTIENGVTSVGDNSFCGCEALSHVTIPQTVTRIGNMAFSQCRSLMQISLPDGLEQIGFTAFSDCTSLRGIKLPGTLQSIGDAAFSYCSNLARVEISAGIPCLSGGMFDSCTSLTEVVLPEGMTQIKSFAFQCCSALTDITIPVSMGEIGGGAFHGCDALQNVNYGGTLTQWWHLRIEENPDSMFHNTDLTNAFIQTNGWNVSRRAEAGLNEVEVADGCTVWLSFTPEANGYYVFTSEGPDDPVAELYSEDENQVGYSDWDGEDENFRFVANLAAGETYYLAVGSHGQDYSDYSRTIRFTIRQTEIHTVTMDANGGSFDEERTSTSEQVLIPVGDCLQYKYYVFGPTDHSVFLAWCLDPDGLNEVDPIYYIPDDDVTLYAKWEEGIRVTFSANGGYLYEENNEQSEESVLVLPGNALDFVPYVGNSDPHKVCRGWCTDPACSGPILYAYDFIPEEDVTLYACWEDAYLITLDANGGYFSGADQPTQNSFTVVQGEKADTEEVVFHENEFLALGGWTEDPDGNGELITLSDYVPTQDVTLYAKWVSAPKLEMSLDRNEYGYYDVVMVQAALVLPDGSTDGIEDPDNTYLTARLCDSSGERVSNYYVQGERGVSGQFDFPLCMPDMEEGMYTIITRKQIGNTIICSERSFYYTGYSQLDQDLDVLSVSLSLNKNEIVNDEQLRLTATVTDSAGTPTDKVEVVFVILDANGNELPDGSDYITHVTFDHGTCQLGCSFEEDDDMPAGIYMAKVFLAGREEAFDTAFFTFRGDDTHPFFASHSLVLTGEIGVNFYMDLSALTEEEKAGSYMVFTVNGREQTDAFDPSHTNPAGNGYYGFTCLINAAQMADEITAEFHYGEGKTITQGYTAKDYIDYVGANPDAYTEEVRTLVAALASYGANVQPFLAANNGWTVGADHAEMTGAESFDAEALEAIREAVSGNAIGKDIGTSRVRQVTYALDLQAKTTVYVYFRMRQGFDGSVSATIDGMPADAVQLSDGRYRVPIEGIAAHELGQTHRIELDADGICTVMISALSYVYAALNSENATFANDTARAAVASLYRYWAAAEAYANYQAA